MERFVYIPTGRHLLSLDLLLVSELLIINTWATAKPGAEPGGEGGLGTF